MQISVAVLSLSYYSGWSFSLALFSPTPFPGMGDYILDDDNTNCCQSKLREINTLGLKRLRSLELFSAQIMSHAILTFPGYSRCNELKSSGCLNKERIACCLHLTGPGLLKKPLNVCNLQDISIEKGVIFKLCVCIYSTLIKMAIEDMKLMAKDLDICDICDTQDC